MSLLPHATPLSGTGALSMSYGYNFETLAKPGAARHKTYMIADPATPPIRVIMSCPVLSPSPPPPQIRQSFRVIDIYAYVYK